MLATVSSTCKNLHYIALLALLCSPAWAAVNLPLTCTGTLTSSGTCSSANRVFALPGPTTLVAVGATYKPFASTAEQVLVCALDIPSGTPTTGCATASKVYVDKCLVAGASCAVNTTGNLSLTWTKPPFATGDLPESRLTGYRIYSGVQGSTLTLLKDVPVEPRTYMATGYGNGVYSLSIAAVYGTMESAQSGPATIEVKIPVIPLTPGAPQSFSITSVTIAP